MDKKVTRKEFLLSALSVVALVAASKVPAVVRKTITPDKREGNGYGNSAYGGTDHA